MLISSISNIDNLASANLFSKYYLANCNLHFAKRSQTTDKRFFDAKRLIMSASDVRRANIRRLIDAAVADGSVKNDSDWCKQRDIEP